MFYLEQIDLFLISGKLRHGMSDVYWEVQFKHRDRKAGKDRAYIITGAPNDSMGALANALEKAKGDNLAMNGDFRVYVYARK